MRDVLVRTLAAAARPRALSAECATSAGARRRRSSPKAVWPLAALMALTCLVALLAWTLGPDSLDRVVVGMVINLIVVVGLYTFVGISGVFSFGHAAFMAIGAYTGAILVIPPETKAFILPDLPGLPHGRPPRRRSRRRSPPGRRCRVALVLCRPARRVCPGSRQGLRRSPC